MCESIENKVIKYIKDYDNFINKVAYNISKKCIKLEFEDVKQQMLLTLFDNCKKYDSSNPAAESTYFSQIIINSANNILKKYWQVKNKVNVECVSLDSFISVENTDKCFHDLVCENDEEYTNPEKAYEKNELLDSISKLKDKLSGFEKRVFKLYIEGHDVNTIAIRLRRSKKTIYNTIASFKEKMKVLLE
jgi:RNA polymerase sigma factor (sigma-70 family)